MRNKKTVAIVLVVAAAFLLGYWLKSRRGPRPVPPPEPPPLAADFALPDLEGRTVRLSDFKGKVVLLDFWATWCIPCIEELPELKALHQKYLNRGFTLVGVSMDIEGKAVVAPVAREALIPYPVLLAEEGRLGGYSVRGIPTAFLISREGRILKRYLGPKHPDELEHDVAAVLDGGRPS